MADYSGSLPGTSGESMPETNAKPTRPDRKHDPLTGVNAADGIQSCQPTVILGRGPESGLWKSFLQLVENTHLTTKLSNNTVLLTRHDQAGYASFTRMRAGSIHIKERQLAWSCLVRYRSNL